MDVLMFFSLHKKEKKKVNRSVILDLDYFGTQMKERFFFFALFF